MRGTLVIAIVSAALAAFSPVRNRGNAIGHRHRPRWKTLGGNSGDRQPQVRRYLGQDPSYGQDGYDYTAADETYYTITALGAQDYLIHFGEGSACIEEYYNDKLGLATADPVAVAPGVTTTGIDDSLQLGGAIEGIVTDAVSGEPVPDLFVSASVPGESGSQASETAASLSSTARTGSRV